MAVPFNDNLEYLGSKPDFTRQQYDTVAEMAAAKPKKMPELYIAFCLETRKVYLYNKKNEDDETYGRWREFGSGGTGGSQVTSMPVASSFELGNVYQYIGPTTESYTQGFFYICRSDELQESFWWEHLPTGDVSSISNEEIDELFGNL